MHFAVRRKRQEAQQLRARKALQIYAIGVYHPAMEFIETPTFTRQVLALLSDEEYRGLLNTLVQDPECGALIKGGGGIRKIRHAVLGTGKSGGV